jgi:DNA repair exonuclease SbcCD ATPase subunit
MLWRHILSEPQTPAPAPEQQPLTPEQKHQEVRERVKAELLQKHTREDGTVDHDGMLEDLWKKDQKAHYANKEAKERRLENEKRMRELEERDNRLKEIEEKDLLEQQKYTELLAKKDEELNGLKEQLKELDRLKGIESNIIEQRKADIDTKVATLDTTNREIYDAAAAGMQEGDLESRLTLLNKLSTKTTVQPQTPPPALPTGGLPGSTPVTTPAELYSLKQSNPELYRQKLRESMNQTK